ncbi:hypothetical protein [Herbaspirillum sp. YR522]|uniref:hypothetical protein n=1 Tax=Herbaspirillum sp. YR522 TaxID=1144342 RepID=UPI00026FB387|nr:hypothetical protein [Herbaspirillum sp. YR522]EJN06027.1 hypothetical protein PMI40_02315 [Herbaspirillum sp. YR522]
MKLADSTSPPRISLAASHAYPGCPVRVVGIDVRREHACVMVEFADGVTVAGSWIPGRGQGAELHIAAHATARGTAIPAKRWWLAPADDPAEGAGTWRVKRRLA